ncbi:hypothetical protein ACVIGB_001099 [Bradyrhizobium sp. USDA 4341]
MRETTHPAIMIRGQSDNQIWQGCPNGGKSENEKGASVHLQDLIIGPIPVCIASKSGTNSYTCDSEYAYHGMLGAKCLK